MSQDHIHIFDIPVYRGTLPELKGCFESVLKGDEYVNVSFLNADTAVKANRQRETKQFFNNSDYVLPDGRSVVWLSALLPGRSLSERLAGPDVFLETLELMSETGHPVFFLGAEQTAVEKMVERMNERFPGLRISGFRNGYFERNEEAEIVEEINKVNSCAVFLGIPFEKRRSFVGRNENAIEANIVMGVGGAFDVLSGQVDRAPPWMQKYGLEWFYRLWQEPGRMWKRYLIGNSLFMYDGIKYICERWKKSIVK